MAPLGAIKSLEQAGASTAEYALGFGLGLALGAALAPEATLLGQDRWATDPVRALDPEVAALVEAEGLTTHIAPADEAKHHGYDDHRFAAMVEEVRTAPAVAELLRMLRRGTIDAQAFTHGLRKAKLEGEWDAPLAELQHERLEPAVIATAIQRGIVHDPGYLPTAIDFAGSDVPAPATVGIDAVKEAAAAGESSERLAVRTRIVGLPPAPGELLRLLNLGEINEAAYRLGIAEGNTRDEWAPYLLKLRRHLLTPHEYAELHLRGWIDQPAMHAGAALSGMETADTERLFEVLGRPIPVHQVTTGEARGGVYNGGHSHIPEAFLRSVEQSNLRPEWYDLAYANRYSYPSAFVLRSLVQTGELTEAEGHETLLRIGWEPTLAEKVAKRWATGTAAKGDPHVSKADNQLWSTLHKSYLDAETGQADAHAALTLIGVPAHEQPHVLARWDHEREIVRRALTPAQIKKAYKETKLTQLEALARLEHLGMSHDDALLLLEE